MDRSKANGNRFTVHGKCMLMADVNLMRINGQLAKEAMELLALKYETTPKTISNIMRIYDTQISEGVHYPDLSRKYCGNKNCSKFNVEVSENIKLILREYNGDISYKSIQEVYQSRFGEKFSTSTLFSYIQKIEDSSPIFKIQKTSKRARLASICT